MKLQEILNIKDFSAYIGRKILVKFLDGNYQIGVCNTFDWTDKNLNNKPFDFDIIESVYLLP